MVPGDYASIFVILVRTFVPFLILRWPLAGTLLAILADTSDIMIFEKFWYGFLSGIPYIYIDKAFDMWALFFEFLVVRKWSDTLARKTGILLFSWRAIGYAVFLIFGFAQAFFYAPNIFEYFFLAMLIIWKFNKDFKTNGKNLTIILLIVGIPNIVKEYIMHVVNANSSTWVYFRDSWFWWLYK